MAKELKNKREEETTYWMFLNPKDVKKLITYYIIIFMISISFMLITFLLYYVYLENHLKSVIGIFLFCIPASLLGSSIYYIKSSYNVCMSYKKTQGSSSKLPIFGAKMYFYLRPFMDTALSIITMLGIYVIVSVLTINTNYSNSNYFILCSITSFYIGYNHGLVLINSSLLRNLIRNEQHP